MSVSSQETVFYHVGNGVTVTFAFGCQVPTANDLSVYVNDVLTTSGFSISGIGSLTGGSITFSAAPANLVPVRIERDIELERTTDYQQNGDFLARVVNPDFDRLWMALQQQFSSLRRALKMPTSDTSPPTDLPAAAVRANKLLSFDSSGNPVAVAPAAQSATALQILYATFTGSSLIGFLAAGIGAILRTIQDKLRESKSMEDFGVLGDNATDNSAAFAKVAAYLATFSPTATLPKIVINAGIYKFATSPNWAIQGAHIEARGNVILKHTGAGPIFNVDGGAAGGGTYRIRVTGGMCLDGNAASTYGLYTRAIADSFFDVKVRNVATAALRTEWAVCNEYRIECNPIGDPAFTVVPVTGISLGKRGAGENTSACTFTNPVTYGVSGYGINLQDAVQCTFLGGASESNGGGVSISGTSIWNKFIGLDMEQNTTLDIFCQGSYNTFDNCLGASVASASITGSVNFFIGGSYNTIAVGGTDNEFIKTRYALAGGAFTDSGTRTVKRSVYNVTSGLLDPELQRNPQKALYIDGPVSNNTIIASDDQVGGGSANDLSVYHYGTGLMKHWINGNVKIQIGNTGVTFNGVAHTAKPVIAAANATDLATAITLVNELKAKLISTGLIG